MIMIQIKPKDLTELEISNEKVKIKEFLVKRLTDENIKLNSLYFQLSDDLFNGFKEGVPALLLHGTCFITESILGQQFQISPLSFFQVNPTATEILYSIIREKTLDAAKKAAIVIDDAVIVTDDDIATDDGIVTDAAIVTDAVVIVTDAVVIVTDDDIATDDAVATEMANLEKTQETPGVVLLDLCCGTGTIGLTMAAHVKKVIGIELTLEAIEDAKKNAVLNGTYLK
jgi:tRNA (uracil-5-)-methyltransferase